jgi:Cu/Ag efflux protein CusF
MKKNTIGMMVAMAMGLCITSAPLLASEGSSAAGREAPAVAMGVGAMVTATVVAINEESREVTFRNQDGSIEKLVAGDEVRNFAQIEVGDLLTIEHTISLVMALDPVKGDGVLERKEKVEAGRAEPGQKPAGTIRKTVQVRAVVRAVDSQARTVTLEGPQQAVTVPVADDIDLNSVKAGDMVDAVYVESLVISVQSDPAQ